MAQVTDIGLFFALSKVELKDVLDVSRQTLYDWLAGRFQPTPVHLDRIGQVHELVTIIQKKVGGPLPPTLVRASEGGTSILDELKAKQPQWNRLRNLVIAAAEQAVLSNHGSAESLRNRYGFPAPDSAAEERNLTANLEEFSR